MPVSSIKDITLGQYAPRDSFIHKLDPRTKLLTCFIMMTWILMIKHIQLLVAFLIVILLCYKISRLKISAAFKNIRPFLLLFLLTVLLHAFFTPGQSLMKIPLLNIELTQQGIITGFFYTFRIVVLILMANLLTLTTSPMSLTDAVENILKPLSFLKIPAHEIAMMMSISIRFIPILIEEMDRIQKAQISRGARFDGRLIHRLKSVVPVIIPLFLSAFRRANDLALAMDARCYRGSQGRTHFDHLQLKTRDGIALVSVFIAGIPVIVIR